MSTSVSKWSTTLVGIHSYRAKQWLLSRRQELHFFGSWAWLLNETKTVPAVVWMVSIYCVGPLKSSLWTYYNILSYCQNIQFMIVISNWETFGENLDPKFDQMIRIDKVNHLYRIHHFWSLQPTRGCMKDSMTRIYTTIHKQVDYELGQNSSSLGIVDPWIPHLNWAEIGFKMLHLKQCSFIVNFNSWSIPISGPTS